MITIHNLKTDFDFDPEYCVRVDRASILGNPFRLKNESFRNEVCDKYIEVFEHHKDNKWKLELNRLLEIHRKHEKLKLFCWCTPKRCHAETIKEYLDKIMAQYTQTEEGVAHNDADVDSIATCATNKGNK